MVIRRKLAVRKVFKWLNAGSISCWEYHEVKLDGLSKGAQGSARCSSGIGGVVELQEWFGLLLWLE